MTYAIMLGVFVILLFLGAPIALSLGMSSLLAILYNGTGINVIAGQIYGGIGKYLLLAVPFFVLSGNIMAKAGISDRLIAFIDALLGHLRGGIAMVCVVVACFFGAISGSGAATVAALGVILIPAMIEREKFSDPFAHGVVAAASSIAVIIPPSISFVIYASLTGVSVGDIFVAGILPGVIMGAAMIIVVQIYAHKHHLKPAHPWKGWREVWRTFKSAFWGLLMPVIILGGIYGGIFSATEAAAVSAVYGLFVGTVIYKKLKWKDIVELLYDTAKSTGGLMLIIGGATIFSYACTRYGISTSVQALLENCGKGGFLVIVNIVLLIAGCFMDANSNMYIFVPIMYPVAREFGIDPIQFGMICTVNLAIGQFTPPVGTNLFVASSLRIPGHRVGVEGVAKACLPMIAAAVLVLLLVTYVPQVTTCLIGA